MARAAAPDRATARRVDAGSYDATNDSAAGAGAQSSACASHDNGAQGALSADCTHALAYASIGWPVFPCGPDKKPLIPKAEGGRGYLDATTDHAQIVAWWRRWPDAQVAAACGGAGIVVLDLDYDRAKGRDGIEALRAHIGTDPHGAAVEARTPRGGRHLVYADPDGRYGCAAAILGKSSGIDVRGVGGYIVVPSGESQRAWIGDDPRDGVQLLPPPPHIASMLPPVRAAGGVMRGRGKMAPAGTATDARFAEVESALQSLDPSMQRAQWLAVIFAVHDALGADERGAELVESWSAGTTVSGQYIEGEAAGTYACAVLPAKAKHGMQMVEAATLFAMARDVGWKWTGSDAADSVTFDIPPAPGEAPAPESEAAAAVPAPGQGDDESSEVITMTDWSDLLHRPPVQWMVNRLAPCSSIVVLGGDTRMGKSFVSIHLSLCILNGREFLGLRTQPGSVLYLCGEGQDGIAARLRAWFLQNSPHPDESRGRYFLVSDAIPRLGRPYMKKFGELLADVVKRRGHAPSLVVVDTLSQGLEGDENDAEVTAPVMRSLAKLRQKFGCSFLIVHHTVKGSQQLPRDKWRPVSLNDIRGSGAITRNADAVLGIHRAQDGQSWELVVLKQKDGREIDPIPFDRHVVQTGEVDNFGQEESSCVIGRAPKASAPVETPQQQLAQRAALLQDAVVNVLRKMPNGTTSSVRAVTALIPGEKPSDLQAAFRGAIDAGRIRERKVMGTRIYTLNEVGALGAAPIGNTCAHAPNGGVSQQVGAERGEYTEMPLNAPSALQDDGQPEKPGKRKGKRKPVTTATTARTAVPGHDRDQGLPSGQVAEVPA